MFGQLWMWMPEFSGFMDLVAWFFSGAEVFQSLGFFENNINGSRLSIRKCPAFSIEPLWEPANLRSR